MLGYVSHRIIPANHVDLISSCHNHRTASTQTCYFNPQAPSKFYMPHSPVLLQHPTVSTARAPSSTPLCSDLVTGRLCSHSRCVISCTDCSIIPSVQLAHPIYRTCFSTLRHVSHSTTHPPAEATVSDFLNTHRLQPLLTSFSSLRHFSSLLLIIF